MTIVEDQEMVQSGRFELNQTNYRYCNSSIWLDVSSRMILLHRRLVLDEFKQYRIGKSFKSSFSLRNDDTSSFNYYSFNDCRNALFCSMKTRFKFSSVQSAICESQS